MIVCFSPPDGSQPTISPAGVTEHVGYHCYESAMLAAVPVQAPPSSHAGTAAFVQAVSLPSIRKCFSRRVFAIHFNAPPYDPIERAVVRLRGHRVTVVRHGSRFVSTIDLRGLPRGTFTVTISLTTVLGHHISGSRTYHTCAPKAARRSSRHARPSRAARAALAMRYVAFGLQISSPFALPGMLERSEESLPALELDIATRSSVLAGWDEPAPSGSGRGRLGDERTLLVERSAAGEHLFSYGGEALFMLDAAGEHLACAPNEAGVAWQRVLLSKVLANVSLIRGYEALHASAVESPEGAVVVLAPSGTGKTALALALARGGWPLLSDDVLTLGCGPNGVLAHPSTPHVNADPQTLSVRGTRRLAAVLDVLGEELWLAVRSSTREPLPGTCGVPACSVRRRCRFRWRGCRRARSR